MNKSLEQKKYAIEVQVQQHKKTLKIIWILLFLMTINIFLLSMRLSKLISTLSEFIQIFAEVNQAL